MRIMCEFVLVIPTAVSLGSLVELAVVTGTAAIFSASSVGKCIRAILQVFV